MDDIMTGARRVVVKDGNPTSNKPPEDWVDPDNSADEMDTCRAAAAPSPETSPMASTSASPGSSVASSVASGDPRRFRLSYVLYSAIHQHYLLPAYGIPPHGDV